MKNQNRHIFLTCLLSIFISYTPAISQELSINGHSFYLDEKSFNMWGVRVASASQNDDYAKSLISNLDDYKASGINSISVFLQGSSGGFSEPFKNGGLEIQNDDWKRLVRIIEACAKKEMVVIVGIFYQRTVKDPEISNLKTEVEIRNAVKTVTKKLKPYRNVIINIANEQNSSHYKAFKAFNINKPENIISLCEVVKEIDPDRIVGGGGYNDSLNVIIGKSEFVDVLLFDTFSEDIDNGHHSGWHYDFFRAQGVPDKPIVNVELFGGWTRMFMPQGVYTYEGKAIHFAEIKAAIERPGLYVHLHSNPWFQAVAQELPNRFDLGGNGTPESPGVRWYFDYIHNNPLLDITLIEATRGNNDKFIWTQARAAYVPGKSPKSVISLSKKLRKGEDVYYDLFQMVSTDHGKDWTEPEIIPSLKIHEIENGYRRSMSDMVPQYHKKTGKVLNIGKSFFYTDDNDPDRARAEVAYAVYNPDNDKWSDFRTMQMPEKDNQGSYIKAPKAGCVQFYVDKKGEVYLPIMFYALTKEQLQSVSRETFSVRNFMSSDDLGISVAVARCSFDGEKLELIELGNSLTIKQGRGLVEPSITKLGSRWYLTLRSDKSAWVSTSTDGIHFVEPKEWEFNNGKILGSYNTQQHWAVLSDKLYLVYTRPAENNNHIFRHRAPLFIAEVDQENVEVIKETEQICVPEDGVALGNFGVTQISENEIWVVTSEYLRNEPPDRKNRVWVAKISR
jgi:hypothetical protein